MLVGAAVIESWTDAAGPISKMAHSQRYWQEGSVLCWLLARGLMPHGVDPSISCLSVLMAVFFPQKGDPRKSKAETVMSFMTKPMEAAY